MFTPRSRAPVSAPHQRTKLTPENAAKFHADFRAVPREEKMKLAEEYFPEIGEVTPKVLAALETLVIGMRNESPQTMYKALTLWADEMYKEATP